MAGVVLLCKGQPLYRSRVVMMQRRSLTGELSVGRDGATAASSGVMVCRQAPASCVSSPAAHSIVQFIRVLGDAKLKSRLCLKSQFFVVCRPPSCL